jgi:NADPH:quinone reductase-like Zn-dependent oxidoreductase
MSNLTIHCHSGQVVFGFVTGGYAEYAVALATEVQPKSAHLTFEEAASVPIGALVAWQTVIEVANVQAGQHVLVYSAAGGVGLYAVQLALWKGARVIGTSSARNTPAAKTTEDFKRQPEMRSTQRLHPIWFCI